MQPLFNPLCTLYYPKAQTLHPEAFNPSTLQPQTLNPSGGEAVVQGFLGEVSASAGSKESRAWGVGFRDSGLGLGIGIRV